MNGPARWRNTSLPAKFFVFDATAFVPFFVLVFRPSWGKLWFALFTCVALAVLSHVFGYTVKVMLRRVRSTLAGPVKAGVAWWHRPQRSLYPHRNPYRDN